MQTSSGPGPRGAPSLAHFSAHHLAPPGFFVDLLLSPPLLPLPFSGRGWSPVRGGLTTPPCPAPPLPMCFLGGCCRPQQGHSGQLGEDPSGQASLRPHSQPAYFSFRFLQVPPCSCLLPHLSRFPSSQFPSWAGGSGGCAWWAPQRCSVLGIAGTGPLKRGQLQCSRASPWTRPSSPPSKASCWKLSW